MILSREHFVAKFNGPTRVKKIEVPGHGTVFLRGLNGLERERLESKILDTRKEDSPTAGTARAIYFCSTVCDASGKLQFLDSDIPLVNTLDWELLEAVAEGSKEFNAMRAEDFDAAEKNS